MLIGTNMIYAWFVNYFIVYLFIIDLIIVAASQNIYFSGANNVWRHFFW